MSQEPVENNTGKKSKQSRFLISCSGLFIVLTLVVILLPNFLRFSAKARQSEAKTNLCSISTAEINYYKTHFEYAKTFKDLNWHFEYLTHYVYFMSPTEYILTSDNQDLIKMPFNFNAYNCPMPGVSKNHFIILGVGNIDADETFDIWWIDEKKIPKNCNNDVNR